MVSFELNELAATLAHEVKNPVSLIKANIDLIKADKDFELYNKQFSVIYKQLNKIDSIISDYTLLCKSFDNKERIYISDLIYDVIEEYDISLKNKRIVFEIDSDKDCEDLTVIGDYSKLSILFFNIIKNAVEAIDGEGLIKTKISKREGEVIIEILDNGCGINEEIKDKIDVPFITSKPNGSGLGLSICKSIINEHNGKMLLENIDGGGCRVEIALKSA